VITSGVLGITTSSVAIWTVRQNAKLARENRTYQRLAESYLEVLRSVEREAQRFEEQVSITNSEIAAEYGDDSDRFVKTRESVAIEQSTVAAHLAIGSKNVHKLHVAWQRAIADVWHELAAINAIRDDSTPGPPVCRLKRLRDVLEPKEGAARQALADAIAEELGQRRKKGNYSWRYGESKF